jgi:hypothetical protein
MKKGQPQGRCQSCRAVLPPYAGYGPKRKFCHKASCNASGRTKLINYTITSLKWGWSKYGGRRDGLRKERLEEWCCQSCGKSQPGELPAYMFPITKTKEFIRICSDCQNLVVDKIIVKLEHLIRLVRLPKNFEELTNL